MYRLYCVFVLCVYALQVEAVYFEDCGSKVGKYTSITVSDCYDSQQNCVLKRNTNATIAITFDIHKDASNVTAVVHGIISGMNVPFPISHPDACADENSGIKCPLTKDAGPYTYTATLFVEKMYPKLTLKVKWELKDETGEDIVCVEIPAKIQ